METDTAVGSVIEERYRLEKLLGQGGHGSVWLAEDVHLKRRVAIKLIHAGDTDGQTVARLQREARVLQRLDHPGILKVFRIGTINFETFFLAIEYVDGIDLHQYLDSGPLTVGGASQIALQVAEAMHEAEKRGVIHRDLKPQNILVVKQELAADTAPAAAANAGPNAVVYNAPTPLVKVADFGLSTTSSSATLQFGSLTRAGITVGTPLYMSPEQCRALPTDTRSDIYALGCVLFEMLTGKPPYPGDSAADILMRHVRDPVPDLMKMVDSSDLDVERLQNIIGKCMAKEPQARYQSFADVAADLSLIAEKNSNARLSLRHAVVYRVKRTPRRQALLLVAASVLVLAGATVVILSSNEMRANVLVQLAHLFNGDSSDETVYQSVVLLDKASGKFAANEFAEAVVNTDAFRRLPAESRMRLLQLFMQHFSVNETNGMASINFFGNRLFAECLECAISANPERRNDERAAKYLDVILATPWDVNGRKLFSKTIAEYSGKLKLHSTIPDTRAGMLIEELSAETMMRTTPALTTFEARFVGDVWFDAANKALRYGPIQKARLYTMRAAELKHRYISDLRLSLIQAEVKQNDYANARRDIRDLRQRLAQHPFALSGSADAFRVLEKKFSVATEPTEQAQPRSAPIGKSAAAGER